jgi:hypothetical protein
MSSPTPQQPGAQRHWGPLTTTDRLTFAIRFAQMELDTLRPGDWLNLRSDIGAFLGCGSLGRVQAAIDEQKGGLAQLVTYAEFVLGARYGIVGDFDGHPLPEDLSEAEVRSLQERVKRLIEQAVDIRDARDRQLRTRKLTGEVETDPIELRVRQTLYAPDLFVGTYLSVLYGHPCDIFLSILHTTLAGVATAVASRRRRPRVLVTNQIRRCPECEKIFLKVRKQGYCSRTCVNKANKRAWRERQEQKTATRRRPGRKRDQKAA